MRNYGSKTKQYGTPSKSYGRGASKKQPTAVKPIKKYNYAEKRRSEEESAKLIMKTLQHRANKISQPSFADAVTPLPRKKKKIRL
jgi:hypothetical protein